MRVDGLLKLDNEKVVLLEIKYAMNWFKCSNARVQFQIFLQDLLIQDEFRKRFPKRQPERALIVFNHFSGDWGRRKWNPKYEDGWSLFYEEEEILRQKLPTIPVDIVQLKSNELKPAPWLRNEQN